MMDRRHFIHIGGSSILALLVPEFSIAGNNSAGLMRMPDDVKLLSGDDLISMRSTGVETWTHEDVLLKLEKGNDSVAVFLQSPAMPVKELQLSWKYTVPAKAKVLGDAWERTYGDVGWQKQDTAKKMPWYCVLHDERGSACFGVKTGGNAFCSWRLTPTHLQLNIDTRNGGQGVQLDGRLLQAADIVTTGTKANETVFQTVRRFCSQMCAAPRQVRMPVYGINDWYFAYGNNSAKLILEHTALFASLASNSSNLPFSIIDDGWSQGTDYTRPNAKFGEMPKLTSEIRKMGMRPGLWTRPLLAKGNEPGNLLLNRPGQQGKEQVLDPSIAENLHYVQGLFSLYRQWGFDMIKHDYSTYDLFGKWGFEMSHDMTTPGWQFNDRSKTNAEIIGQLYRSIRDAAGDTYLIGCNTISHLSAGLFELNRIGDDTSGKEWARTKKMGVNTLAFRMAQHKIFYEADGDCVGLTPAVPWEKNKQWMQLLALSSTPLFISGQPEAVGKEQEKFIRQCFDAASKPLPVAEPLDWLDDLYPSKWKLDGKQMSFNWDQGPDIK